MPLSLFFFSFRKKTLGQAAVFAMACLVFCAVSFLSPAVDVDEFSDLGNYFSFWSELNTTSFSDVFIRYEPGFFLLCKLCSMVFSFSAFRWLVQFLVFYSMFLLGSRYTKGVFAAAAVAIACLLFYIPIASMATLVIRQGIATAVFFCFLARYHGGEVRWFAALPWIACMVLFHYSSAFVFIALMLLSFAHGMRAFYVWCVFMVLYSLNASGQIGVFFYDLMGLNVASLNALNNSSGVEYQVGFKVNFLLLNAFYVGLPAVLVLVGVVKVPIRALFSDNLFRLYFVLNALATVFSLMPFYDRFFMWSWAVGPIMLLAVLSGRRERSSALNGVALVSQ
jgi:hypothetical protein